MRTAKPFEFGILNAAPNAEIGISLCEPTYDFIRLAEKELGIDFIRLVPTLIIPAAELAYVIVDDLRKMYYVR